MTGLFWFDHMRNLQSREPLGKVVKKCRECSGGFQVPRAQRRHYATCPRCRSAKKENDGIKSQDILGDIDGLH